MTTTTIEVMGLEGTIAAFLRLEDKLTKLKPLWEVFGKEFYSEEKSLFAEAPWKPLSPAYAKRKQQKYGDKGILRATDRLYNSLTEQGVEGNVHRVRDDGAEFGSSVPYGIFHKETRDPIAEPDEERYGTLAGEYVMEMIREAGFS